MKNRLSLCTFLTLSYSVGVQMMKICCFWETEEMNEQYQCDIVIQSDLQSTDV